MPKIWRVVRCLLWGLYWIFGTLTIAYSIHNPFYSDDVGLFMGFLAIAVVLVVAGVLMGVEGMWWKKNWPNDDDWNGGWSSEILSEDEPKDRGCNCPRGFIG